MLCHKQPEEATLTYEQQRGTRGTMTKKWTINLGANYGRHLYKDAQECILLVFKHTIKQNYVYVYFNTSMYQVISYESLDLMKI